MNKAQLIKDMIKNYQKTQDLLMSTNNFLNELLEVCNQPEEKKVRKKKNAKVPDTSAVAEDKDGSSRLDVQGSNENTDGVEHRHTNQDPDYILLSVDASIKVNPGGQAAIGAVIRFPGKAAIKLSKPVPAKTNNEAEYDAIYEALNHVVHLKASLDRPIMIHSDSQLVVYQLTGKYQISEENKALQRRAQIIHELAQQLPVAVGIEWRPRNSTQDLTDANHAAQDLLGVKRH